MLHDFSTTNNLRWFCGWKVLRILNIFFFENWTFVWKKNNYEARRSSRKCATSPTV